MLRVVIVNTHHYPGGGDSSYTFNLANLLQNKGHNVAFFAMHDDRNLPDPNDDLFVSHINFRELNSNKNLISGSKVLMRVIYSTETRNKFDKLLSRVNPDIIHLQNIHAHITPSIIFAAKQRRLPIFWTLHDYKLICPNSHFLIDISGKICEACRKNSYYQAIFKRCKKNSILASTMACIEAYAHRFMKVRDYVDVYISPSSFLRSKLIERGYPSYKVRHISHFLPDDMFKKDKNHKGSYLLYMGKLEPIKGIYQLFQASRMVPQVKITIAGRIDKSLVNQLARLMPSNVNYVGLKQGKELSQLVRGSLAIVLPSLCYENQPFSILEAFAASKPVIASNLGGMSELVKHRERGLLVPPDDVNALADAMKWMVSHREDTQRMGESAFEYAIQEHSAEVHYEKLMAAYLGAHN